MNLESGKKYVDRCGRVFGPLVFKDGVFREDGENGPVFGIGWSPSGRVACSCKSLLDLVAEFSEPAPVESRDTQDSHYLAEQLGIAPRPEKPMDDSEAWVVQDRVPFRYKTDQCRWVTKTGEIIHDWFSVQYGGETSNSHGHTHPSGDRFEVRCRRKNLPPVQSVLQKAVASTVACMNCTTCGDFCEKKSVPEPKQEWPKYYVGRQWVDRTAFIRRDSEYSFIAVRSNGTTFGRDMWGPCNINDVDLKEVSKEEAFSRLDKVSVDGTPTKAHRSVVVREWACWEDERESDVALVWSSRDPTIDDDGFIGWDNAVLTDTPPRTISLPVSR